MSNSDKKIDVIAAINNLLMLAGMTKEDYARETGLWKNTIPSQRLLNEKQAIKYLGNISKPTLYKFIRENGLKQVSLGAKMKRYDIKDLDKFISKHKKSQ